jgi:hypothetical protein
MRDNGKGKKMLNMNTVRVGYTNAKGVDLKVGDTILWNYGAMVAPEYSTITSFAYDGSWVNMESEEDKDLNITESVESDKIKNYLDPNHTGVGAYFYDREVA